MFEVQVLAELSDDAALEALLSGPVSALEVATSAVGTDLRLEVQSVTDVSLQGKQFAVPVFETLYNEETLQQQGGERSEARTRRGRDGRLVWIDMLAALRLTVEGITLEGPVAAVSEQSLFARLGDQAGMPELETAVETLVPAAEGAAILERLGITSIADYRSGRHRIVDVQGTAAPAEPVSETVEVDLCVLVFGGGDFAQHLRNAVLARAVLERETALQPGAAGRRTGVGAAYLVVLSSAAIAAAPIPGSTAAESEAAIRALFRSAGFLTHFAPEPGS